MLRADDYPDQIKRAFAIVMVVLGVACLATPMMRDVPAGNDPESAKSTEWTLLEGIGFLGTLGDDHYGTARSHVGLQIVLGATIVLCVVLMFAGSIAVLGGPLSTRWFNIWFVVCLATALMPLFAWFLFGTTSEPQTMPDDGSGGDLQSRWAMWLPTVLAVWTANALTREE